MEYYKYRALLPLSFRVSGHVIATNCFKDQYTTLIIIPIGISGHHNFLHALLFLHINLLGGSNHIKLKYSTVRMMVTSIIIL